MTENSVFSRIINREIPSDILYQDELVTAFRDNNPQAPVHILIVSNEFISSINDVTPSHEKVMGRLFIAASIIARNEGIDKDGYRTIVNCNRDAGQEINHLHMHLLGGRYLGPLLS